MTLPAILKTHRVATMGVAIGLIILAGVVLWSQRMRNRPPGTEPSGKSWFTVDDGQTFFADDRHKLPPFLRDGKIAYRCVVYTCDNGKTRFVVYLERLTPAAREQAERMMQDLPGVPASIMGVEVKKPLTGDRGWVSKASPEAKEIVKPRCPNGSDDLLQEVFPPS
jgi:hypothetical protein